jgi:hypothetical protein
MTQPETSWPPNSATPPADESPLGKLGLGAASDRTGQLYRPANPEHPGWPSYPAHPGEDGPDLVGAPGGTGGQEAASRRSRRIRLVALGVVVVVLAAAVTVLLTRHTGGAPAGTGSASSAMPSIDNVRTDPAPLTVAELFPGATVTTGGFTLSPVAQSVDSNCSLAAHGLFASALTAAKCEQVLRVTFATRNKHYVVTAGVAALPTLAAAHQADSAENFGSDSWFTGLDGPAGSGAGHVTTTPGYGYQTLLGRYIIFALATPGHGKTANTKSATLSALSHDLTSLASQAIVARER